MKLHCLIGKIVVGFVRTEFILSEILFDFGFETDGINFFSEVRTGYKLMKVKDVISDSNVSFREDFVKLIEKFRELNEIRNIVVHGLALESTGKSGDYRFYKFTKNANGVKRVIGSYSFAELEKTQSDLVELHNSLVLLSRSHSSL